MYHEGEQTVRRRAGVFFEDWGSAGVNGTIPPVAGQFLTEQRMVVIGAADDDGTVWAGPLAGPAGFITPSGDRTIVSDRLPTTGDPLAGLFETERELGMLAIEPASRRRMRANGRAHRDGDRLVIHTDQVYGNCPKYIQTRAVVEGATPLVPGTPARSTELTGAQQNWIADADTVFVATQVPGLGADVSHRGGNPGFLGVSGTRLTWPDYTGNAMFMTLGNLELNPRCGLLFLDWEDGHALYLTGQAYVDWDQDRAAQVAGAERLIDFNVEQVVQIDGAVPLRWSFGKYSRFNPAERS
jgi:predicted pyridoxine 5'-phosphate oxidase superfamily flavin-nucleotide-binding protein